MAEIEKVKCLIIGSGPAGIYGSDLCRTCKFMSGAL